MRSPGEYSLMWANNHINKLSWDDLVALIREEAVASAGIDVMAEPVELCTRPVHLCGEEGAGPCNGLPRRDMFGPLAQQRGETG